ncbi:MAG: hypothetical protein ACFFKA_07780, partial [Candidatus Thorarchaeota archaeon]
DYFIDLSLELLLSPSFSILSPRPLFLFIRFEIEGGDAIIGKIMTNKIVIVENRFIVVFSE